MSARRSRRLSQSSFRLSERAIAFFWIHQGFDQRTDLTILTTHLSDLIKRNAATPNLQKNVFIQANLPSEFAQAAFTTTVSG